MNCKTKILEKFAFGLILFTMCALVQGCNGDPIREKLTGDGVKYWDAYNRETGAIEGAYRFSADGSCIWMANGRNGRYYYMPDDVIASETWTLKQDFLTYCDRRNSIISISDDTLILRFLSPQGFLDTLTKSQDQSDVGVPPNKLKRKIDD